MDDLEKIRADFEELKVCVVIPTYNNKGALAGIITDVLAYTRHIVIVNDGSTDESEAIIKNYPGVHLISYPDNAGKGGALRKAFTYATDQGYKYAVTIDADRQYFTQNLPLFIDKLRSEPDAIIIGSRKVELPTISGKSNVGDKLSNFWFRVETGINCPDTQSGYRIYPLCLLKNIKFITCKNEFETEVMVRAAWKGIKIDWVDVYDTPGDISVSHSRSFGDLARISILHIVLLIIAFLYIKPRDFFRTISSMEKSKQLIKRQFFNPHHSVRLKAASVAFGVFMGIVPIWGFQLIVAISLAILFRLNKALVVLAAHISIPPMIPVVIFLSYKAGGYWMGSKNVAMPFTGNISLKLISLHVEQYIYGSLTLAIFAATVAGLLTFTLLKLLKRKAIAAA
jgi:glycosyltransferase involved in cell wall biosynthesis